MKTTIEVGRLWYGLLMTTVYLNFGLMYYRKGAIPKGCVGLSSAFPSRGKLEEGFHFHVPLYEDLYILPAKIEQTVTVRNQKNDEPPFMASCVLTAEYLPSFFETGPTFSNNKTYSDGMVEFMEKVGNAKMEEWLHVYAVHHDDDFEKQVNQSIQEFAATKHLLVRASKIELWKPM